MFSDGDPGTGTPGTVVDDDWLNAVQEEIAAVIEHAGITLTKGHNDQLSTAITLFFTNLKSGQNTWSGIQHFGDVAHTHIGDETHSGDETFNGDIGLDGTITLSGTGAQSILKDTNGTLTIGTSSPGDEVIIKAGGVTRMTIPQASNMTFFKPFDVSLNGTNSWTSSCSFYRDPSYRVFFTGTMLAPAIGDSTLKALELPTGYAPSTNRRFICASDDAVNGYIGVVLITTDGYVYVENAGNGHTYYFDSINFLYGS
jgi:hypothetical protein